MELYKSFLKSFLGFILDFIFRTMNFLDVIFVFP